jgi:hypothetical protein
MIGVPQLAHSLSYDRRPHRGHVGSFFSFTTSISSSSIRKEYTTLFPNRKYVSDGILKSLPIKYFYIWQKELVTRKKQRNQKKIQRKSNVKSLSNEGLFMYYLTK